jgi:hypothetical protein
VGNPSGVVQALCEQGVMSSPSGTRGSRWCRHLQSEQIGDQEYGLAFRTVAAESHRAPKQATFGAAPLAEGLCAAVRTLVHRVRHQQSLALELLGEGVIATA